MRIAKTINVPLAVVLDPEFEPETQPTVRQGSFAFASGSFAGWSSGENIALSASTGKVNKQGSNSGTWTWLGPSAESALGEKTVTITARDGRGMTASATFSYTVYEPAPADQVVLFSDPTFAGTSKAFDVGSYADAAFDSAAGAPLASSIKVGANVVAVLHGCDGFGGGFNLTYHVFEADADDLSEVDWQTGGDCPGGDSSDGPNDNVRSLWVMQRGCFPAFHQVALFNRPFGSFGFNSACVLVGPGEYGNPMLAGLPNDFVGEVLAMGGVRFTGWSAADFQGEKFEGSGSLFGFGLSSFKVEWIDTIPPQTTLQVNRAPQPNGFFNQPVQVSFVATDNDSGVDETFYRLNGSPPLLFTAPISLTADGHHVFDFLSLDRAGNQEASKRQTVTLDTTPPQTSVVVDAAAPAVNGWFKTPVTLSFEAVDDLSGIMSTSCRIDGGAFASCPSPPGRSITSAGRHLVEFFSRDESSNTETPRTALVQIDVEAPRTTSEVTGERGSLPGVFIGGVAVTLTATDAHSGVVSSFFTLDGGPQQQYTGPIFVSEAGSRQVHYWSIDTAGHEEAKSSVVFFINNPVPVLQTISRSTVLKGSAAFDLGVTGTGFVRTSKVTWNGVELATVFNHDKSLTARVPAELLNPATIPQTASIEVVSPAPGGGKSSAQPLTIVDNTVVPGQVDAEVAPPGGNAQVSTAPDQSGEAGLTATLSNPGSEPATLTTLNYSTTPAGTSVLQLGGSYFDVKVTSTSLSPAASLAVKLYYPTTLTGMVEQSLVLRFWDGSAWQPLLGSGGAQPVKDTTDNLDGTVSGGRISFTLDNTSTPKLSQLSGTELGLLWDSDADGVPDSADRCAGTPSGQRVDSFGCTALQGVERLLALVDTSGLPAGNKTSLKAALDGVPAVLRDTNQANDASACGRLSAFLNQLEALERSGRLSAAEAATLRAAATATMALLGC